MRRILVVDDDESFRRPLGATLRQAGYEVQIAAEGSGALKLYRQQPFDLVVTDLVMPGKEGLETILELRRLEPGLKIIAISGEGDYLPMAQRLGAATTLAKPFTAQEILEAVASLLPERP